MWKLNFRFLGFLKFQLNSARHHPNPLGHWRWSWWEAEPSSVPQNPLHLLAAGTMVHERRLPRVDNPMWLSKDTQSRAAVDKLSGVPSTVAEVSRVVLVPVCSVWHHLWFLLPRGSHCFPDCFFNFPFNSVNHLVWFQIVDLQVLSCASKLGGS